MKPAREDGSIGIEFSAVVSSIRELMERMDWLHAHFDSPVLIEEYIEGREIYVGVIGNDKPEALPVVELDLSKLPDGTPRIAAAEVKWGKGTKAYRDTKSAIATDLSDDTVTALQQTAVAAYQALELRDYGRVDMRLQADGRIHVIEVNPNPWLSSKAEFAMAARKAGRTYSRWSRRSWSWRWRGPETRNAGSPPGKSPRGPRPCARPRPSRSAAHRQTPA